VRKLLVLALALPLLAAVEATAHRGGITPALGTRGPVGAIAADSGRAAVVVHVGCGPHARACSGSQLLCATVKVWEPTRGRATQLDRTCPNDFIPSTGGVALAATRAAWLQTFFGSTDMETVVETATLARPRAVTIAYALAAAYGSYGDAALAPVGDGRLIAFTVERRCEAAEEGDDGPPCPPGRKTGDVISATIWRVPGNSRCPSDSVIRRCARVAQADGKLTVLAADAGRIAARTDDGVSLFNSSGGRLRDFAVTRVRAGALSGNRLAVRVPGAIEIYDTGSAQLASRLAVANGLRLEDLDRGILVTASGSTVRLRRLRDGRTTTIRRKRIAHAQLEQSGLFVASGRRVTFTPMSDILRRLGGSPS
jgi:hypothetical protein